MQSGIVSLRPLYDFVATISDNSAYELRCRSGRQYVAQAARICETIAPVQGFYLWGAYDGRGFWRNIYLGNAGFGRTAHLRARIFEELKDERACIWRSRLSVAEIEAICEQIHPTMWPKYKPNLHRALKKSGTTHIVWVADPELENAAVQNVESDLIETLNPFANVSRPVPPTTLQERTTRIVGEFRAVLHAHRSARFTARMFIGDL